MAIILHGKQPSSKGKGHLINYISQSMRLCNPCSSESSTSRPHSTPCGLIMIAKSTHFYVIPHNCKNEIVHIFHPESEFRTSNKYSCYLRVLILCILIFLCFCFIVKIYGFFFLYIYSEILLKIYK